MNSKIRSRKKLWDEENIEYAVDAVNAGESIRRAAKNCRVPESTLRFRLKNPLPSKTGKHTHLSRKDEDQLVKYADYKSNIGQPIDPKWLKETASRLANKR